MNNEVKTGFPPAFGLVVGLVAVSFAGIIIKNCGMHPWAMATFRMLGGGLVLLPLAWPHLKRELSSLDRKGRLILLLAGFFLAIHFVCWMESLNVLTVASATMTLAVQPVFAAVIGHFSLRERFKISTAFALVITLVGLAFIALDALEGARQQQVANRFTPLLTILNVQEQNIGLYGIIFAVLSALFITAVISCGKVVRQKMHIFSYSSSIFLIAGVLLTPSLFMYAGDLGKYAPRQWFFMGLMVLVPTLMGHTLFYWAVKYIKVITINLSALTEPVLATIGAAFLLPHPEIPRMLFLAGGAVILGGVAYHLSVESREKIVYIPPTD